jgi:septum formation protein
MSKIKLVLGSASPRRKELLSHLGISFEIRPSHVDETCDLVSPFEHSLEIAKRKNLFLLENASNQEMILTADTVVALDNQILGKPQDVHEARQMLMKLSGRTHQVATAIVVHYPFQGWKQWQHVEISQVTFQHISSETLERYLATGESMDKAGAYGIQGSSLAFISKVEGCYASVVGFPLARFHFFLENELPQLCRWELPWRSYFIGA